MSGRRAFALLLDLVVFRCRVSASNRDDECQQLLHALQNKVDDLWLIVHAMAFNACSAGGGVVSSICLTAFETI